MKKYYILPLVIGLFLALPFAGHAQLLEVNQTVFGMDCAPCAYGLEQRIKKMDGVQSASVSLNKGLLVANLEKNNQLTLQDVREAVEESGFQAREATISVRGTVTRQDDGTYILETALQERFVLKAKDKSALNKISEAGQTYTVTGKAEVNESGDTILWIQDVEKRKA